MKRILNYNSFHILNKEKLAKSAASIVFSNYMSKMIGGGHVPKENRIALALGFSTSTKGWDILKKMDLPSGWTIAMNSSRNHYSVERYDKNYVKNGIINLRKDFLSEEELSLLFSSADAVILPYKVSSGSGVMFDALAHGLPFVATDLNFFNEFSKKGLGITLKRDAEAFSNALADLDNDYNTYKKVCRCIQARN